MSGREGAPLPTTGVALYRWARAEGVLAEVLAWGRRNGWPPRMLDWPPRAVSDAYAVGRAIQVGRALAGDDDDDDDDEDDDEEEVPLNS